MKIKNHIKKGRIALFFMFILVVIEANAFTTNSTEKTFDFAVKSGGNERLSSGNYSTFVVVGDQTAVATSSNYRAETGFTRTTGFITGESCKFDRECTSNSCCNGFCAASCTEAQPGLSGAPSSASSGSTAQIARPIAKSDYEQFFTAITANSEVTIKINKYNILITEIVLKVNEDLIDVSLSVKVVENPSFTIANGYQYFTIESDKINSGNIDYAIIKFKVEKSAGLIKETVALNRYHDGWQKLDTSFISEDGAYYYYQASSPGLSLFAITGEKEAPPQAVQNPEEVIVVEAPNATAGYGAGFIEKKKPGVLIPEQEIAEKIEEPKTAMQISILIVLLLSSLAILIYSLAKIEVRHTGNLYNKFYELLFDVEFYIKNKRIADADRLYYQLLEDYKKLIKRHINEKLKIDTYGRIKKVHENLCKAIIENKRAVIKTKV